MRSAPVLALLAFMQVAATAAAQSPKAPRLDRHGDPLPDGAVVRLGSVRYQPSGHVRSAAISPDGRTVALATEQAKGAFVHLIDAVTGRSARQFGVADASFDQMQFTPDSKFLVLSGWSAATVVEAETGKIVRSLRSESSWDTAFAITPDGKRLASQPRKNVTDAPVILRDLATGNEVASLPGKGASGQGLAFGPDGRRLLLRSVVRTAADEAAMIVPPAPTVAVTCIDVEARKIIGETTVGTTQHVALSPDGETVALEAADHASVRVRHLPSGAERCVLTVQHSKFAFTPDGKALLTVNGDGEAALWDVAKGAKIRDPEGALANKDFLLIGVAKDGRTAAAIDGGWRSPPAVIVWDLATGKRADRPAGHQGAITCLAYAPGGKLLATGSLDRTVRLWDPATGAHVREQAVHGDAVTAVAFSPDGKLLATSSRSGATRVSGITDGKAVAAFSGPDKGATALGFSADGKVLFAGAEAGVLLGWEVATSREVLRLKTGEFASAKAFAPGGAVALTADIPTLGEEGVPRMHLWDLSTKVPVISIPLKTAKSGDEIRCEVAAFSADGRLIASSQIAVYQGIRPSFGDALLRLWERGSGQPVRTLAPAISHIAAFSPDGRLLASGGTGQSGHLTVGFAGGIDVWDTLTGSKVGTIPATPSCAAFSPDGKHLATGGRDHDVLIWTAPRPRPSKMNKLSSAAQREAWWNALSGQAREAYKALAEMTDTPDAAVALLKERVQPVRAGDPATVARLIAQLDGETFPERAAAQEALEKMGEGAAHLIRKARDGPISLELRRRLDGLLRNCDATSVQTLRNHRAVAALEWIGTPAARAVLRTLADGAPSARLTVEARAALHRLQE